MRQTVLQLRLLYMHHCQLELNSYGLQRWSVIAVEPVYGTAVLEEASCIVRADRRDRCTHRLHQRLASASLHLAQQSFDLLEGTA